MGKVVCAGPVLESELDIVDTGRVTAPALVGTNVLNDNTKIWAANIHKNRLVRIISGPGIGQTFVIDSNIASTLVIKGAWVTALGTTSEYVILGVNIAQVIRDVLGAGSNIDLPAELASLHKLIPIAKAAIFNTALPAAEANWLGSDIEPTNSPSYLRIYTCVSVTGILRVARTVAAVTVTEDLNSGTTLTADAAYMFTVPWRTGDSINIRYSVTTGTIKRLLIDEIGGAE
ncbi:unnamed protein product [marine sediment metagenome]|uniref:Uncharacterized protein n=1 Tax=marine sediment metagenome TaxID=412755 RepID=X1RPY9_9ZZZZ